MSFRDGSLLWLLLLVPLAAALFLYAWRGRVRAHTRFGDLATTRRLIVGHSPGLRALRAVIFTAGLALLVVALAGPQYGSRTRLLRKRGIDVVIALDFSKSMLARDVSPNRIDRAKAELSRFIQELDGDRVGIVAFAGETMEFPMTVDYAAMSLFLRDMTPADMPVGGTAIGRALTAAGRLLERSNRQEEGRDEEERSRARVIILLTDGEDHEGSPVEVARTLSADGVKVYVIGIGSRSGEPIPTYAPDGTWTGYMRDEQGEVVTTALTAENEATLREIAEVSGGKFFRAREGGVGVDAIRAEIAHLQQSEREARRVTVHEDRFALVLLFGFLLLLLEALMPDTWRLRRQRQGDAPAEGSA